MFWVDAEYSPKEVTLDWVKKNGYAWFTDTMTFSNAPGFDYFAPIVDGVFIYAKSVKVRK